jgi:hypothetical protein
MEIAREVGTQGPTLDENLLRSLRISVYDPFSDFLHGSESEKRFDITFLDVIRFSGHACLSMAGAFLMARAAAKTLFPEDGVCVRGLIGVDVRGSPSVGATGPIANVLSYITGAWAESGFGGFDGNYIRRGLLRFQRLEVPSGAIRFTRQDTGRSIDVFYHPERAEPDVDHSLAFQTRWRLLVREMLLAPDEVIEVVERPE